MRIKKLTLENYRGFRELTLDLERDLTVLVGLNGSGKTSVLMALATMCSFILLSEFGKRRESLTVWRFEDLDLHRDANSLRSSILVTNGADAKPYSLDQPYGRGDLLSDDPHPDAHAILRGGSVLVVFYQTSRSVGPESEIFSPPAPLDRLKNARLAPPEVVDALAPQEPFDGSAAFGPLFRWFKEREDLENEAKVSARELSLEDPELRAVRQVIAAMLDGFSEPRVQREPLHLLVRKGPENLAIDQLSDGEKSLLTLAADLGRRLLLRYRGTAEPLHGEAVVLIDEVEQHLHPGWQRTVLPKLRNIFPGCQFIVTTHSPQVLSSVDRDEVILLDNFQVARPQYQTHGRDSNAILRELLGVEERPPEAGKAIHRIGSLLDDGKIEDAKSLLADLEQQLGWSDGEVIRLKTRLEFLEEPIQASP
jgi:predicted ATP-binding protein involved in virulence